MKHSLFLFMIIVAHSSTVYLEKDPGCLLNILLSVERLLLGTLLNIHFSRLRGLILIGQMFDIQFGVRYVNLLNGHYLQLAHLHLFFSTKHLFVDDRTAVHVLHLDFSKVLTLSPISTL